MCSRKNEHRNKTKKNYIAKSTYDLFECCCGAIDGLVIKVEVRRDDTPMVTGFFSGSKHCYCVNFQGVCDANRRFIGFSCKFTGSTNDVDAFEHCNLFEWNCMLPWPLHWNADWAYGNSETLMTPVPGVNLHLNYPEADSWNYWQSQLRIIIECTFGMFIQRWEIFWTPLQFKLQNCLAIINCCMRLHNFCVETRLPILYDAKLLRSPPEHVLVDRNGRLINDIWREGISASDLWKSRNTGNVLREQLIKVVK